MRKKIETLVTEFRSFIGRQYFVILLTLTTYLKLLWVVTLIGLSIRHGNMTYGYVFSAITAALIFLPFLYISRYKKIGALLVGILVSIVLFGDVVYFRFFQALPTVGVLDTIGQSADVLPSVYSLIKLKDIYFFIDIATVCGLEIFLARRYGIPFLGKKRERQNLLFERVILGVMLVGMVALIVAFNTVPYYKKKLTDAISWSYETRENIKYFGLPGAHLIDFYRTVADSYTKISPAERDYIINWAHENKLQINKTDYTGVAQGKRVIIIQVESLGNFVIGKKIRGQEITPNLNMLVGNSHYFANQQHVLGGGHTSDTDFVATTSYWPLFGSSVFIKYPRDSFTGLIQEVKRVGYEPFAYHAYNRNFWNRSVSFGSLGFNRFYAKENYSSFIKDKNANMEGLGDREFMSETFKLIKEKPQKSLGFVITLSSHFPFRVTDATKGLNISIDDYPAFAGGYLQNINYTDAALGDFFRLLKDNNMYDDSLIVVYGDHNPTMGDFTDGEVTFSLNSPETQTAPFIVKLPNQKIGVVHHEATTHLDITPTILDLLGLKTDNMMFGASVFDRTYYNRRCTDGFIVAPGKTGQCEAEKSLQKDMAAKIIRFNLFSEVGN